MATTSRQAVEYLAGILSAADGLPAEYALLALRTGVEWTGREALTIEKLHIAPELLEKGAGVRYPAVYVYCDRVVNSMGEKFRSFSGTADLHVEVRVSHDHAAELTNTLELYMEALTNLLERKRGQWTSQAYYAGGYEAQFGAVKKGGRNYIQSARVKLQVHISVE